MWGIEGHAAHPALDLLCPQLCALLFLLNQPDRSGEEQEKGKEHVGSNVNGFGAYNFFKAI